MGYIVCAIGIIIINSIQVLGKDTFFFTKKGKPCYDFPSLFKNYAVSRTATGVAAVQNQSNVSNPSQVQGDGKSRRPWALDLFCGTNSVGKRLRLISFTLVSLDITLTLTSPMHVTF